MGIRLQINSGDKFNYLTVKEECDTVRTNSGGVFRKFICKCECGNELPVLLGNLRNGHTKSCGCKKVKIITAHQTTHGKRFHPLYIVWAGMKQRCTNSKSRLYKYYGGRGIQMCEEWIDDFEKFFHWAIAIGWRQGLEIDRINNDGNYEPENCRFVNRSVNNKNRRKFKRRER